MYTPRARRYLTFFAGFLWAASSLIVNAADSGDKADANKQASKKAAAAKPDDQRVKSKFMRGSEESPGERNARLKRECKGAVNAGVCAGFTR